MKTLFILLTFLFSLSSMGAIVGNQSGSHCGSNSIQVYGRCIDLSNPNIKVATMHGKTVGNYTYNIAKDSAMVAYQVPSGTKAVLLGFRFRAAVSSATQVAASFGYNDNELYEQATVNSVHCDQGTADQQVMSTNSGFDLLEKGYEGTCGLVVPTGKFPYSRVLTASQLIVTAYFGECADTGPCEFHN